MFSGSMMFNYIGWKEVSAMIKSAFAHFDKRVRILYEVIKPRFTQQLVQLLIEYVPGGARQIASRHPHRLLLSPSPSQRHRIVLHEKRMDEGYS